MPTGDWPLRLRRVAGLLAFAGVVAGFFGYLQLDHGYSRSDALYGSLQLLLLAGPSGRDETLPMLLEIGRLMAPVGSAGALALELLNRGAVRVAHRRARRAHGHRVVIGDSDIAQQLALAGGGADARHRHRLVSAHHATETVLVASVDAANELSMRQRNAVVVQRGRALRDVLRGADEVVVAHESDVEALDDLETLAELLHGSPTRLRVVLHRTELAAQLRSEATDVVSAPTIVSRPELAALHLTGPHRLPDPVVARPMHTVVIGDGEVAEEVAVALGARFGRRGAGFEMDLVASGDPAWTDAVVRRSAHRFVVVRQHGGADGAASTIAHMCTNPNQHHRVFVVGLADDRLYPLVSALANQAPEAGITTLAGTRSIADRIAAQSVDRAAALDVVTLSDLLMSATSLDFSTVERLGQQLLVQLARARDLPADGPVVAEIFALDPPDLRERSEQLARTLLDRLVASGFRVVPHRPGTPTVTSPMMTTAQLLAPMTDWLRDFCPEGTDLRALSACFRPANELPVVLRDLGYDVVKETGHTT